MSDSVPLKSTGAVQLMIASPSSSIYDLKCITGPTLPIKQDLLPYYGYTLEGQSLPSTVIVTVLVSITCAVEFMTMHSTSTLFISFSGNISIDIRTKDDLLLIYFSVTIPARLEEKSVPLMNSLELACLSCVKFGFPNCHNPLKIIKVC